MEVEVVADSDTSVTQLEWDIQQKEGLLFLQEDVEDNSVDLILTDPPYIISRDSGMNTHYNNVKKNEKLVGTIENRRTMEYIQNRTLYYRRYK